MTVEKPKPKQLLRPITTGAGSAMNQSQFLAITCNSLEAQEKSRVRCAIGFGFDFHWLKNWRDSFKPITKRGNRNHVITFDSHLKTALMWHSLLNDMEIIETKRFTPKGSEQGTTLTLRFGLLALILEIPHQSFSYPMKITVESVSF